MADLLYLVAGLALLLAVILPRLLQHVWLSPPLVLVCGSPRIVEVVS